MGDKMQKRMSVKNPLSAHNRGWHNQPMEHGLAAKGIKSSGKNKRCRINMMHIHKGLIIEAKEHPSLSPTEVENVVIDHLKQDPDYYTNKKHI